MFRYQWRAFWRRALRTHRIRFYLTTLVVLGAVTATTLPRGMALAAGELATGRTSTMNAILLLVCALWLVAFGERLDVSLSAERLRRFPVDVRTSFTLPLLSRALSPLAWFASVITVVALGPLLAARHPVTGMAATLLLITATAGAALVAACAFGRTPRRVRSGALAMAGVAVFATLAAAPMLDVRSLVVAFGSASPARLVTAVATATTPAAMVTPAIALLALASSAWALLLWTFHRHLQRGAPAPLQRQATSRARFPGRLGPLIQKERHAIATIPDLWIGAMLAFGAAAVSMSLPLSPTVRHSVYAVVCALNANVTLNTLGLERPPTLTRYRLLPITGSDLMLAKNIAMLFVVPAQLAPLLAMSAWQSGGRSLGGDIVAVVTLLFGHLAWGNVVSVFEPRRTEPYRFASAGDPVTTSLSVLIGSAPGLAVIVIGASEWPAGAWVSTAVVIATLVAYRASLHVTGRRVDRRAEDIGARLA